MAAISARPAAKHSLEPEAPLARALTDPAGLDTSDATTIAAWKARRTVISVIGFARTKAKIAGCPHQYVQAQLAKEPEGHRMNDLPRLLPTKAAAESYGGVTYQVEGELVPVLTVDVSARAVYFEHHILLWKHPSVHIGA